MTLFVFQPESLCCKVCSGRMCFGIRTDAIEVDNFALRGNAGHDFAKPRAASTT